MNEKAETKIVIGGDIYTVPAQVFQRLADLEEENARLQQELNNLKEE